LGLGFWALVAPTSGAPAPTKSPEKKNKFSQKTTYIFNLFN